MADFSITEKTCSQCGDLFTTTHANHIYCSLACTGKARRRRVSLTCSECGKHFTLPLSKAAQKFCSNACKDTGKRMSISERMDKFTNKTDTCWVWTGATHSFGYGIIGIDKKTHVAHRIAWQLRNGPIPDGMFICHKCDNPPCVNPEHLFVGTQADNMADMIKKGRYSIEGDNNPSRRFPRHVRGAAHGGSVLKEPQVHEIRRLCAAGIPAKDIARQFGVSPTTVSDIKARRRWSHI